jgi:xylulokinase
LTDVTTDYVLALDIGLTNAKAVVFDVSGALVARTSVSYPTERPEANAVEQDPAEWWSAVAQAVRNIAPEVRRRLVALGVTAHMHALVCLRSDGTLVGRSLVLGDRRAAEDARLLTARLGEGEIYAATGAELDASMPAAKVHFLKRRDPAAWTAVAQVLGCKDYIRYRLTGELATDPIDACATSLFDLRTGRWSTSILEAVGISERLLPPLASPWAVAGGLAEEPAKALGLRPGLPVAIGSGDDVVVLGFGLLDPGVALEHIGTTGSVMTVTLRPINDPDRILELYPHVLADRWVVGGSHTTAGAALGWAASFLGYRTVDEALAVLDGGDDHELTFLPTLAGERFPARVPEARGAWLRIPPDVTREDLMRASFVGVAGALAAILGRLDRIAGWQQSVRATIADNESWIALRARMYRRCIEVSETNEPTALGLATLVAVAASQYRDVREAVESMTRVARRVPVATGDGPEGTDPEAIFRHVWVEATRSGENHV